MPRWAPHAMPWRCSRSRAGARGRRPGAARMRTSERYCCWTGCRRWARPPPRPALPAKHPPRLAACACLLGGGPLDGPAASAPASASLLSLPVSCGRHCDLTRWRAGALLLACGAVSGYCVFGLARATYAACFPPVRPRARPRRRTGTLRPAWLSGAGRARSCCTGRSWRRRCRPADPSRAWTRCTTPRCTRPATLMPATTWADAPAACARACMLLRQRPRGATRAGLCSSWELHGTRLSRPAAWLTAC